LTLRTTVTRLDSDSRTATMTAMLSSFNKTPEHLSSIVAIHRVTPLARLPLLDGIGSSTRLSTVSLTSTTAEDCLDSTPPKSPRCATSPA
jgi:hypothetical protein